jgi:hypothetical protein
VGAIIEESVCRFGREAGGEVEAVKAFSESLNSWPLVNSLKLANRDRITIRSVFVHRRPLVKFVDPANYCGHGHSELGDLLFIVKRFKGGRVVDYRGSFAQSKLGSSSWSIPSHQYGFMRRMNSTTFEFGDRAGERLKWCLVAPRWSFSFLFIGERFSLNADVRNLRLFSPGDCRPFTAKLDSMRRSSTNMRLSEFLAAFLGEEPGFGFKVRGRMKSLMHVLYRFANLEPDPPDEFEGFYSKDGGFTLVEFTVQGESREGEESRPVIPPGPSPVEVAKLDAFTQYSKNPASGLEASS